MSCRIALAMCCLLVSANRALGQEPRGYVGAGFGTANFKVSSINLRYINDFEPGRVTSLTAEAGVLVSKLLAVSAEVWLPLKRRTITQEHGYIMDTPYRRISNYRERAFLCVLHGRVSDTQLVAVAGTAGSRTVTNV